MLQIESRTIGADQKSFINVSKSVFSQAFNESLVHQVVISCLSNRRQGTHRQKTRAEVSGGGAKPWNQKGSGRARAGTIRSPIWRHGGVTFAARTGVYSKKINKKMYQGAMRCIFSQLIKENRLIVVDAIVLEKPKTRMLNLILKELKVAKPLIIVNEINHVLGFAVRNLINTNLISVKAIDPAVLLSHESIIITKEAIEMLDKTLKDEVKK